MSRNVRTLLILTQIVVSVACLGLLAFLIDWQGAVAALKDLGFSPLAGAVSILVATQLLAAWRMQIILRAVGVALPFGEATRLCWLGLASGNILPSTIGGDVFIIIALSRIGSPIMKSVTGLILNRVVGLLATLLCLPAALAVPKLVAVSQVISSAPLILALLGVTVLAVGIVGVRLRPLLSRRLSAVREIAMSCRDQYGLVAGAFLLSLGILVLGAITFQILLPNLPDERSFVPLLAIVSLVMVAQLVPISFNGLGIQEGLLTTCLALVGWTVESAAVAAIAIRLITIGVSLPGLLWIGFLWRHRSKPMAAT